MICYAKEKEKKRKEKIVPPIILEKWFVYTFSNIKTNTGTHFEDAANYLLM